MIVREHRIRFSADRAPIPKKLRIGYESDNMVERLLFELPDVAASQTATMMMDGEYANMVTLQETGKAGEYYADLTAERVGVAGETECYIVVDGENGEVWNSGVFRMVTGDLPDVSGELSELYPDAIDQMRGEMAEHRIEMDEQAGRAEAAADRAEAAEKKPGGYYVPQVSEYGILGWSPSESGMPGVESADIRGPKGEPGEKGERGEKGETGPEGQKGETGQTGAQGEDGFSPTVAVTDIAGGHRVTITDATGNVSFDVMDSGAGVYLPLTGGKLTGSLNLGSATSTDGVILAVNRLGSDGVKRVLNFMISNGGSLMLQLMENGASANQMSLTANESRFKVPLAVVGGGTGCNNLTDFRAALGISSAALAILDGDLASAASDEEITEQILNGEVSA